MNVLKCLKLFHLSALMLLYSPEGLIAQDIVRLSGTTQVLQNRISISKENMFIGVRTLDPELISQNNEDGRFNLSFQLSKPDILIFRALYKNWFIYFKPGDQLTFKITGIGIEQKLIFYGRGETRCNLFAMVSQVEDSVPLYFKYMDFVKYKAALDDWLKASQKIIASYLVTHKVEKEAVNMVYNKLNYKYASGIYATKNEAGVKPTNYFLEADKFSINQNKWMSLRECRLAIFNKFILNRKLEPNVSDLELAYKEITTKLSSKTQDFALANLAGEYVFKQSPDDAMLLRKIFDNLYIKQLDSTYLSYLKDSEMRYFVIGKPLPDDVLNNTILVDYADDNSLTLAEV